MGQNSTHYRNKGGFYNYLIEGGAHNRDMMILTGNMPEVDDLSVNLSPTVGGVTYWGNCSVATGSDERSEAWSFREIILNGAILPEQLADGTTFGELQYFKQCTANSAAYGNALLGYMTPAQLNNGFWIFTGQDVVPVDNPVTQGLQNNGHSEPWMQAYVQFTWGHAKVLYTGDKTIASDGTILNNNMNNICRMMRRFFEGFWNDKSILLQAPYIISCRVGYGETKPWRANWHDVAVATGSFEGAGWVDTSGWIWIRDSGTFYRTATGNSGATSITINDGSNIGPPQLVCNGGAGVQANTHVTNVVGTTVTIDRPLTSNIHGPITFGGLQWWPWPFYVGAKVLFSADIIGSNGVPVAPVPFIMDTQPYYVVAVETPNFRFKLGLPNGDGSFNPSAAPIIPSGTLPVTGVVIMMLEPPAAYTTSFPSPDDGTTWYAQSDAFHDSYNWFHWQAIRAMRTAGISDPLLGDSARLQSADANVMAMMLRWMGGTWNRGLLSDRTFAYTNV